MNLAQLNLVSLHCCSHAHCTVPSFPWWGVSFTAILFLLGSFTCGLLCCCRATFWGRGGGRWSVQPARSFATSCQPPTHDQRGHTCPIAKLLAQPATRLQCSYILVWPADVLGFSLHHYTNEATRVRMPNCWHSRQPDCNTTTF